MIQRSVIVAQAAQIKTFSGPLVTYWNGYNGGRIAIAGMKEIAAKPGQALYSVFSGIVTDDSSFNKPSRKVSTVSMR